MAYILFLISLLITSVFSKLPDGWKACNRTSPDYDDCFLREFSNAVSDIANGGMGNGGPTLDPLRIETIHIPKANSPVSVDLAFSSVAIEGIKNFKMLELKNDWKTMKGKVFFPDVPTMGDYKIDGQVLVLPIVGEGKYNFKLYNTELHFDAIWKTIEKGGKKYFQMDKLKVNIVPKKITIELENLYNGNKALGDSTNLFLNENWEQIFSELKPGFNKALGEAYKQICNIILSKIPADEIDLH